MQNGHCIEEEKKLSPSKATGALTNEAWLVYNGDRPIKIDRDKVANSCWYFEHLLSGAFKEAKQYTIDMNFEDAFSFDAFKCIIRFANDGEFLRDARRYAIHLEAIQLAILWNYDKFVNVVQDHLIDRNICRRELDVLTTLAKRNLPQLSKLSEACDQFAEKMARREPRRIPRCSIQGHKEHMYLHCTGPKEGELLDDDWEAKVTNYISEEERFRLAIAREEAGTRRHKYHDRDPMRTKLR